MNHAFIILAHNYPEQLREIVSLQAAPNHFFFIHVDAKADERPFRKALKNMPNVRFIEDTERIQVHHGGFSMVRATVALLRKAQDANMDYVHLLSGQDYPCAASEKFDAFFERHEGTSYMHYDSPEEAREWRKGKYPQRYKSFIFRDLNIMGGILNTLARKGLNAMFRCFPFRSDIPNVAAGWQWFSWHRTVVNYTLKYIDEHPSYLKRWNYTHCSDEMFFHTLLNNMTGALRIERYNSLRFIEWYPKREYKTLPLVLDEREYEEIVSSKALFCRKVHPELSRTLIRMLNDKIKSEQ